MKSCSCTKINNILKSNTFARLKLFKYKNINKIINESLYISNKLSKEMNNINSRSTCIINKPNKTNNPPKYKIKKEFHKFIVKKIHLNENKNKSTSFIGNIRRKKRLISSFEEDVNYKNKNIKDNISFSSIKNSYLKKIDINESLNEKTLLSKRKIVNIEYINNLINLSNESNILITNNVKNTVNSIERSKNIEQSDPNNTYNEYKIFFKLKSNADSHELNNKRIKRIKSNINLLKDNITNIINNSSSLYNRIINLKKSNKYHINHKSLGKEIDNDLYDDIDMKKIY